MRFWDDRPPPAGLRCDLRPLGIALRASRKSPTRSARPVTPGFGAPAGPRPHVPSRAAAPPPRAAVSVSVMPSPHSLEPFGASPRAFTNSPG